MTDAQRPTYDFTTTSGVVAKIKTDITGREKRAIDSVVISANSFSVGQDGKQELNLGGEVLQKYNDEMVKQLVIAVADKSEAVLDMILDLSAKDSAEIFSEVQRKYQELSGLVKKKSN